MGITPEQFYNAEQVAILPMGFCYPGTGKSGDLPPRPECAPAWRERLLRQLPNLELTLVIGQYALAWHLEKPAATVTENVLAWRESWPGVVPLPHPSPRNNMWLRRNPWFESELLPELRKRIAALV
jgi:uracil-DNA glycosylase